MFTNEEEIGENSPPVFDGTDPNFVAQSSPEISEPSEQEILRNKINAFNEAMLREISLLDQLELSQEHLNFQDTCQGFFVKDFGEILKLNLFLEGRFQIVECFSNFLFRVGRAYNFYIFSCSYGFVVMKKDDLTPISTNLEQIGITYALESAVALIDSEEGICEPI
jgi:hypothetical protein